MAIKRSKTADVKKSIPAKLADFCQTTFTSDAMAKFYEDMAKDGKAGIKAYLENNDDGFELDLSVSKGFDCDEGRVSYATRKRFDYDADAILALVKSGALTVETLLNCISTFKDKDLQNALGSNFAKVSTEGSIEFLQLKANENFKAKIAEIVTGKKVEVCEETVEKSQPKKSEPVKTEPAKTSGALSLDDILNGKV
jgi:hypothetical protein